MTTGMQIRGFRRNGAGFSVVELLVALTLGLLLVAGMIQLFTTSKITFRTNDALARVQENGRFALEILKRQLREAGTTGFCSGRIEIRNHLRPNCGGSVNAIFDPNRAIVGWEYSGTGLGDNFTLPDDLDPSAASPNDWDSSLADEPDLPQMLRGLVVPGSDVLVLRRLSPLPQIQAEEGPPPNNPNQASINLVGPHGLPDNALLLVTNCSFADLFQNRSNANASALSAGGGSCNNPGPGNQQISAVPWSTSYGSDMQALAVELVAFYIGMNAATGRPGLYRLNMSNGVTTARPEELIEGAETMQILYGFSRAAPDGDGQSINDWLTADQVPADGWQQVLAIQVALSVRSPETADFDDSDITFNLSGAQIVIRGDGRIRQPFSTTVALRNRVITL